LTVALSESVMVGMMVDYLADMMADQKVLMSVE
jgi:hypothetical protein